MFYPKSFILKITLKSCEPFARTEIHRSCATYALDTHSADTNARYLVLFCAVCLTLAQVVSAASNLLITDCPQVCFGRPGLRMLCEFKSSYRFRCFFGGHGEFDPTFVERSSVPQVLLTLLAIAHRYLSCRASEF